VSYIISIDASDANTSGIFEWLLQLLSVSELCAMNDVVVYVFASKETINRLPSQRCVRYKTHILLGKGILMKYIWKRFFLDNQIYKYNTDVFLSPNGDYLGAFPKFVAMNHNMVLLQPAEMKRFFPRFNFFRLLFLSRQQRICFENATKVIALTEYSKISIENHYGIDKSKISVIPNGIYIDEDLVNSRHNNNKDGDIRIIYASTINEFKHHANVVEAMSMLVKDGVDIKLTLAGGYYRPSLRKLKRALQKYDPDSTWIAYRGLLSKTDLYDEYKKSDIGLFASTCEALPFVLIEMMRFGLPIACSNYGVMPSIVQNAAVYFDPLDVESISCAVGKLVKSRELRTGLGMVAQKISKEYSGSDMSSDIFDLLMHV